MNWNDAGTLAGVAYGICVIALVIAAAVFCYRVWKDTL